MTVLLASLRVSVARDSSQRLLWPGVDRPPRDQPVPTMASTRNICGDFFEEASRVLFHAKRHRTDGRCDVCPDLSLIERPLSFIEAKSVGCTRAGIIYEHRLRKDREFVDAIGAQLTYVFWMHRSRVGGCDTRGAIHCSLARTAWAVVALSLAQIEDLCRFRPARKMNYRAVHRNRPRSEWTPAMGFRIPLRELIGAAGECVGDVGPLPVYRERLGMLAFHGCDLTGLGVA